MRNCGCQLDLGKVTWTRLFDPTPSSIGSTWPDIDPTRTDPEMNLSYLTELTEPIMNQTKTHWHDRHLFLLGGTLGRGISFDGKPSTFKWSQMLHTNCLFWISDETSHDSYTFFCIQLSGHIWYFRYSSLFLSMKHSNAPSSPGLRLNVPETLCPETTMKHLRIPCGTLNNQAVFGNTFDLQAHFLTRKLLEK